MNVWLVGDTKEAKSSDYLKSQSCMKKWHGHFTVCDCEEISEEETIFVCLSVWEGSLVVGHLNES